MTAFDFTLEGYQKRLEALLDKGYSVSGQFRELESSRTVYLRHDVDLSMEAALEIATVEAQLGVRSTFFILLNSDFYNPFSVVSRRSLETILELGHFIGLHFDRSVYEERTPKSLSDALVTEKFMLESISGTKLQYFSQHRPATHGFFRHQGAELFDVYSQIESQQVSYFSDSSGTFRFGDYSDAVEAGMSFQLLTHPIWWSVTKHEHPRSTLEAFLRKLGTKQANLLGRTVSKFDIELGSPDGWPAVVNREQLDTQ